MPLFFDCPHRHVLQGHQLWFVPQLTGLEVPQGNFKAFDHAEVLILSDAILLDLYPQEGSQSPQAARDRTRCTELDSQLRLSPQLCSSSFSLSPL